LHGSYPRSFDKYGVREYHGEPGYDATGAKFPNPNAYAVVMNQMLNKS
jgi:hypothetical protein